MPVLWGAQRALGASETRPVSQSLHPADPSAGPTADTQVLVLTPHSSALTGQNQAAWPGAVTLCCCAQTSCFS